MSYAIIRNLKYKRENLKGIYRHNERKNYNYSNRNIDKEKSYLNYAIKEPLYSYEKEFDRLKDTKIIIKKANLLKRLMFILICLEELSQQDVLKLKLLQLF